MSAITCYILPDTIRNPKNTSYLDKASLGWLFLEGWICIRFRIWKRAIRCTAWWCNVHILKNHGLRQWGLDDIPYIKWTNNPFMLQTTNSVWREIDPLANIAASYAEFRSYKCYIEWHNRLNLPKETGVHIVVSPTKFSGGPDQTFGGSILKKPLVSCRFWIQGCSSSLIAAMSKKGSTQFPWFHNFPHIHIISWYMLILIVIIYDYLMWKGYVGISCGCLLHVSSPLISGAKHHGCRC